MNEKQVVQAAKRRGVKKTSKVEIALSKVVRQGNRRANAVDWRDWDFAYRILQTENNPLGGGRNFRSELTFLLDVMRGVNRLHKRKAGEGEIGYGLTQASEAAEGILRQAK